MTTTMLFLTFLVLCLTDLFEHTFGCTNILVTPGASEDGSSMIAYDADFVGLMGMLYHYPPTSSNTTTASDNGGGNYFLQKQQLEQGEKMDNVASVGRRTALRGSSDTTKMRQVYDWDEGTYLGEIPEAVETYNVVGNTNEYGLSIGETTFGGIEALSKQSGSIIDYGSLIWITLQRSKTAREAIHTMVELTDKYGYASSGESFSIADGKEVWIMEVIGRGEGKHGFVWVAVRVPDGMVAAHANQARIQTFPRDDPENCMYADDVVELARELGLYDDNDEDFSFSDTYDPVTFEGARLCDARVWSIFSHITEDNGFEDHYADYAKGQNLSNRMPLWIKPSRKLTLKDVTGLMRDHYEDSVLDPCHDVGAEDAHTPYRTHPLVWEYEGDSYVNERTVATQQTGWNFVAQQRHWMPPELSSILWFAVDDSGTAPRYPVYGSSRDVSDAFFGVGPQDGVPSPILEFDLSKAFWVSNMVSNFAYSNWRNVAPVLVDRIKQIETEFLQEITDIDAQALELYNTGDHFGAIDFVTEYSVNAGNRLHKKWFKFYGDLFARFRDGYELEEKEGELACGCKISQPGYSDEWYKRIVEEDGDHYKESMGVDTLFDNDKLRPIKKKELKSFL
uniref:Dipeptidase n=1 Tax=Leptocylindrus danicus TaxID=163516 RepID=A0A7S2L9Z7_9STRA|mmetsp:Transcript_33413/g.48368  ORF Transcript_33413/g.48368 Transcript_33413/m.48368 type:complete len:621 (+) Transcript_33413:52-1914(+)